jgi:SlyX protein
MNENRIIELEIKVAYQEDLLQDLNRIVIEQQAQLDRLDKMSLLLIEHIRTIQTHPGVEDEGVQIPPHY